MKHSVLLVEVAKSIRPAEIAAFVLHSSPAREAPWSMNTKNSLAAQSPIPRYFVMECSFVSVSFRVPVDRMGAWIFFEGHAENDEQDRPGDHQDAGKYVERQSGIHRYVLVKARILPNCYR
jgi:hypothetical protein